MEFHPQILLDLRQAVLQFLEHILTRLPRAFHEHKSQLQKLSNDLFQDHLQFLGVGWHFTKTLGPLVNELFALEPHKVGEQVSQVLVLEEPLFNFFIVPVAWITHQVIIECCVLVVVAARGNEVGVTFFEGLKVVRDGLGALRLDGTGVGLLSEVVGTLRVLTDLNVLFELTFLMGG